jgi:oligopeptide transport system permease protein
MTVIPAIIETTIPDHPWWFYFLRQRAATVSAIFIAVILIIAIFGPSFYLRLSSSDLRQIRNGVYQNYESINASPSSDHWLGADYLGRDTLTRLLLAIRVSLLVALVVETINVVFGGALGLIACYFGGWADMLISRLADMLFAFPGLLLAILVSAVFGTTARELYGGTGRLLLVASALSLVSWPLMARLIRSETLSLKSRDFIIAARGLGATDVWMILNHMLPNVAWLIAVAATLDVASVIVNEATLSLLGLGIEEPGASLGLMIFRAVGKLESHPIQVFVPALTITALVLSFSFLGDGLRDALDPRSRQSS